MGCFRALFKVGSGQVLFKQTGANLSMASHAAASIRTPGGALRNFNIDLLKTG
jgi:hypothetical protein